ncbi:MAG: quinone oxidoreductase [Steroidobacteraceae bacterium]|nr:quinone oxidoreductase [Steroidobacteraceae bacterium]MDW8258877.1 quinone oxidoreductase [Gammaproteobacteria bacterium]
MSKAIVIHAHGGPEVLRYDDIDVPPPGPGQVQIRQTAIGLNFIDTYYRSGLYPMALPGVLGQEAAGVIAAVGPRVRGLRKGDRVAYVDARPGAYAELRNIDAARVIKLPQRISDELAAAAMLKGLTAEYLLRRTYRVRRGDAILVYAAAGGVGLILCQWARALGAKVIGVAGNEAKAALAKAHGAHHVLLASAAPLAPRVRELTRGAGVAVVYDAVGKDTFIDSLDCLRPRGLMVSYGNASGPPPAISPLELSKRGSLFLTRPTLFTYTSERRELEAAARALFRVIASGKVRIRIGQRYALADAAQAHRDLEARRTTGSSVLLP